MLIDRARWRSGPDRLPGAAVAGTASSRAHEPWSAIGACGVATRSLPSARPTAYLTRVVRGSQGPISAARVGRRALSDRLNQATAKIWRVSSLGRCLVNRLLIAI